MQTSSIPNNNNEYVSRSDEAEASRLEKIAGAQGLGDVQYLEDEDVRQYSIADFNMLGVNGLGGMVE